MKLKSWTILSFLLAMMILAAYGGAIKDESGCKRRRVRFTGASQ